MQIPAAWRVEYKGMQNADLFGATVGEVGFTHCVLNKASTALHIFNAQVSDSSGNLALTTMMEALNQLGDKPFKFQFVGVDGDTKSQQQTHYVLMASAAYSRNDTCTLTVLSGDVLATINLKAYSRAYQSTQNRVSDIVKQVIQDEGLDLGQVEDSKQSQDFPQDLNILHQPYITTWRWIIDHLIPKTGGMWCLYSPDSTSVNFATPWYKAQTLQPPPEAVTKVREIDHGYATMCLGGYDSYGEVLDPLTKKLKSGDATGEPKSFGQYEPRWKGLRAVDSPIPDIVRESDQDAESYSSVFEVLLMGNDKYNGQAVVPPLIVDLSQTNYRLGKDGKAKGVLVEAFHHYARSQYTIKCTVKTDSIQ